jgi:hypothetical protein
MIDQIYDRDYATHRADMNRAFVDVLGEIVRASANAFKVLNRIEYSAPWAAPARGPHCG